MIVFWEVLPRFGPPFRSVPSVFAPFGSVAVFATPLGLPFPADIDREGFESAFSRPLKNLNFDLSVR
jgi:hypothetical protein